MQEKTKIQHVPVKVYRTADRLMVAAPVPGLMPEDIKVKVTDDNTLLIQAEVRGLLKDIKELLVDEWSVGGYSREVKLPNAVDAKHANLTYGNGVLVIAFPISDKTIPADLTLETVSPDHGERQGYAGSASRNKP